MGYHHHMGTIIESAADIDRFMEMAGPAHPAAARHRPRLFGGADPAEVARKYMDRVTPHPRQEHPARDHAARCASRTSRFLEGVRRGAFTVPGDPEGCVAFEPVLKIAAEHGYSGWLVIEAEQDSAVREPFHYQNMGLRRFAHGARWPARTPPRRPERRHMKLHVRLHASVLPPALAARARRGAGAWLGACSRSSPAAGAGQSSSARSALWCLCGFFYPLRPRVLRKGRLENEPVCCASPSAPTARCTRSRRHSAGWRYVGFSLYRLRAGRDRGRGHRRPGGHPRHGRGQGPPHRRRAGLGRAWASAWTCSRRRRRIASTCRTAPTGRPRPRPTACSPSAPPRARAATTRAASARTASP